MTYALCVWRTSIGLSQQMVYFIILSYSPGLIPVLLIQIQIRFHLMYLRINRARHYYIKLDTTYDLPSLSLSTSAS